MSRSSGPKIVIVGGGSNAWTPQIVRDILLTPSLARSHIVLHDIRKKASDLNKAFLDLLQPRLGSQATIVSTNQQARAFDKADYFIITISTGGLDAMAHDLAIPQRYGIYQTVGDSTGPGGWARFIRNFDVFADMAKAINRYAPGAMVLNYTNPMATLTDVLARLCQGPVVGLCHGLFENIDFLQRYYRLKSEHELSLRYGGLNHFFWITHARARQKDVLADLAQRLKRQSFTDLLRDSSPDPMGFKSNREVATELFRLTGVLPYLGDRHTCEFVPWYLNDKGALGRYKIIRTTVAQRRTAFRQRHRQLERMVRTGKIPAFYERRSRETAADIIDAHSQGKTFIDVGNTPNTGQIENLPRGVVVETAVRVDATGLTPLAFGPLPRQVLGLVEPHAHAYQMVVDACMTGDRQLALQALRLDPLSSRLDGQKLTRMGQELLGAHKRFITAF
ncbi:MAG TPA: hypothetical protein VF184_00450 [Phycisphaeraceae bacterium]